MIVPLKNNLSGFYYISPDIVKASRRFYHPASERSYSEALEKL